ncbi:cell division control protein 6-like protein [Euroglyphus maynei]|uniref:Cell division control protein 6-like protein n=1 Tax=Euroglyphus maynei TaxID=6958 RepID=A0A1Y3BR59_EURMA|nr:cell division control protein 6-like protein [Euroglyphus maynei]
MLSSSYVDRIVGRDDEYKKLTEIIDQGLSTRTSVTIYISGPAGTGKTLTTTTVIEELSRKWKNRFKFISMNCMSFQNATDFYASIVAHFERRPKRVANNASDQNLEQLKSVMTSRKTMTVFLMDEIDQLQSKNQHVLNSIFRLPLQLPDRVILIGIANALDFTTKTMSWLRSGNENCNFHEIRFLPYRKEQIVQIIETRLRELQDENKPLIDRSAIEFCARKIASCSGDIRKALDVCRRAIELIDNDSCHNRPKAMTPLRARENTMTNEPVTVRLMMDVLNKVYGTAIDKIDSTSRSFLPSDQQVVLSVFLVLLKIRSLREVRLSELREMVIKICRRRGISEEGKSESDILNMCQYLSDYGYVKVNSARRSETLTGSPFSKRTPSKSHRSEHSITLSLVIDSSEAEQLISTFHRSIVDDAHSFV